MGRRLDAQHPALGGGRKLGEVQGADPAAIRARGGGLWRAGGARSGDGRGASGCATPATAGRPSAAAPSAPTACALGVDGLAGSADYHLSPDGQKEYDDIHEPRALAGERALMCQSPQNIEALCQQFPSLRESFCSDQAWAENLRVDGLDCAHLCVGDTFDVVGRDGQRRALQLEVASPRRPCSNVDKRHGKIYTQGGVRSYTSRTGTAGWFFRVLAEGELAQGDTCG